MDENKIRDYHDFSNIDTSEEEREKLNIGDIWINSAICHECNEEIRSRNKHDYVSCSCGNVSVDGGSHYAKRNFKTHNFTNKIIPYNLVNDIGKNNDR